MRWELLPLVHAPPPSLRASARSLACRRAVLIHEGRSQNPRGVIRWQLAFRMFANLSLALPLLTQSLTRSLGKKEGSAESRLEVVV